MPNLSILPVMSSLGTPGFERPATSPFTSAMKTGTPSSLKDSARTFNVTVLPVPVAPAIIPCLLDILGMMPAYEPPSFIPTVIRLSFSMIYPLLH